MSPAQFSELIGAIYEANTDPEKWATLAERVAKAFAAESGSLQVQALAPAGTTKFLSGTANITDLAKSNYEQYYFQHDVYVRYAIERGLEGAYLSQNAVAPSDVARSEFYTDWGKDTGIFHVVGGGAMVGPASVALLAVHRPMLSPAFGEDDRRYLEMLLPHLGRALQIAGKMGGLLAGDRAKSEALERLNIGTIVVAGDGRIVGSNAAADRLFRSADGILSVSGRLKSRRHQDLLHRMIQDCASTAISHHPPGGVLSIPRSGRAALSLLVGPLDANYPGVGTGHPAAIIFAHDPETIERQDEATLRRLYCLTAAEARLAAALVSGERLQTYAERQGVTLATVKTQLRQILAKTGSERQADLVARLVRNGILRMAATPG